MGINLKKILFLGSEDEFEENEEYYGEDVMEEEETAPVRPSETYTGRPSNITAISGSSIEMKVVTPSTYESVTQIADLLLSHKTVLLNLEKTNKETSKRLIDFLSGVAYALSGEIQKVADNTYAITPSNVAVSKETVGNQAAEAPVSDEDMSF